MENREPDFRCKLERTLLPARHPLRWLQLKRVEMTRATVWLEAEKKTSSGQLTYHVACGGSKIKHCLCLLWNNVISKKILKGNSLQRYPCLNGSCWGLLGTADGGLGKLPQQNAASGERNAHVKNCSIQGESPCGWIEKVWRERPSCSKVWKQKLNRAGILIHCQWWSAMTET